MCVVFEKEPLCKPLLKDITPVILGLRGDAGVDDLPVRLWEGYFELVININIHYYYTCIFLSPLSLPGLAVSRSGTDCRLSPCVDDGLLYLEVLWNTPLHSWTGVASEASVTCSTKNISENPSLGCAIIIITCAASVRHLRLWDARMLLCVHARVLPCSCARADCFCVNACLPSIDSHDSRRKTGG